MTFRFVIMNKNQKLFLSTMLIIQLSFQENKINAATDPDTPTDDTKPPIVDVEALDKQYSEEVLRDFKNLPLSNIKPSFKVSSFKNIFGFKFRLTQED